MGPLHRPRRRRSSRTSSKRPRIPAPTCCEFGELPGGDLEGGNFLRPAIVVDPDPSLRVVTQEQFGPVIPILPFDTEDEAVAAGQRHLGRSLRLGLDGRCRRGQPRRRPAGVRLCLGQRPWRHPPRPARAVRRHEAVGHGSRAGHRGHPRVPGHPLDRPPRCGHAGDDAPLIHERRPG